MLKTTEDANTNVKCRIMQLSAEIMDSLKSMTKDRHSIPGYGIIFFLSSLKRKKLGLL
jgi:hypothetical protein